MLCDYLNADTTAAIANLTTVVVALGGGFWVLYLYTKTRRSYPRIVVEHETVSKEIGDSNAMLVRVVVRVTNEGEGLLVVNKGFVRLLRVEPWSDEFLEMARNAVRVKDDDSYIEEDGTEVRWTMIARRDLVEKQHVELEPGEQEEFCFDFIIKDFYDTILVYSYFENAKKSSNGEERGWVKTTMFEVGETR